MILPIQIIGQLINPEQIADNPWVPYISGLSIVIYSKNGDIIKLIGSTYVVIYLFQK